MSTIKLTKTEALIVSVAPGMYRACAAALIASKAGIKNKSANTAISRLLNKGALTQRGLFLAATEAGEAAVAALETTSTTDGKKEAMTKPATKAETAAAKLAAKPAAKAEPKAKATPATKTPKGDLSKMPECPRHHREDAAKARCEAYFVRSGHLNPRHTAKAEAAPAAKPAAKGSKAAK